MNELQQVFQAVLSLCRTCWFGLCDQQQNLTHSLFFSSSDLLKVRFYVDDALRCFPVLCPAPLVEVSDEEEREGCTEAHRSHSELD